MTTRVTYRQAKFPSEAVCDAAIARCLQAGWTVSNVCMLPGGRRSVLFRFDQVCADEHAQPVRPELPAFNDLQPGRGAPAGFGSHLVALFRTVHVLRASRRGAL
jgi:hypothetical protein